MRTILILLIKSNSSMNLSEQVMFSTENFYPSGTSSNRTVNRSCIKIRLIKAISHINTPFSSNFERLCRNESYKFIFSPSTAISRCSSTSSKTLIVIFCSNSFCIIFYSTIQFRIQCLQKFIKLTTRTFKS